MKRGSLLPSTRGELRRSAEVVIIGGGVMGLSIAYQLARRGVRDVVVLESEAVGHGASGRNGGFVFGGFSLDCARLLEQQGPERARAMYALTRRAVQTIRDRIARHAIACDAVEGGVVLANWFDDPAPLLRRQQLMARHFDTQWEYLTHERLGDYTRSARYADGLLEPDPAHPARQRFWLRVSSPLPDDPAQHVAAFTYLSDVTLMGAALAPHGIRVGDPQTLVASLDHAVWFHRPFRADEWWLYDQVSPSASGGRGLVLARVFTQDGTLVASVAQEALIRPRGPRG